MVSTEWLAWNGAWHSFGRASVPFGSVTPSLPVLGVDKPNASNTGLRMYTEDELTTHVGDFRATASGQEIEGLKVYGSIIIPTGISNVHIHDCIIRGNGDRADDTDLIEGSSLSLRGALIEDCVLDATGRESPWRYGVTFGHFTMRRCEIKRVVDGISLVSGNGNVIIEQCWIHNGFFDAWVEGDSNYPSASGSLLHGDGIQIHRGKNIRIAGNTIGGSRVHDDGIYHVDNNPQNAVLRSKVDAQDESEDYYNAALMIKQETTIDIMENVVIEENWLGGGSSTVNTANKHSDLSGVTLRNNRFMRADPRKTGHRYIIKPNSVNMTVEGNVFDDDGTSVPVRTG